MNLDFTHHDKTSANESSSWWREMVTENPMLHEGQREVRRFLRSTAALGRFGPPLMIFVTSSIYLWLLFQTYMGRTDSSIVYCFIELILITLALPGSVYGAISGEREKATWEALILTRLTPAQIIAGKFLWRMRLLALIVAFLVIPVFVSRLSANRFEAALPDLITAQVLILLWGTLLCSFGLWVSSITNRAIASLTAIAITIFGLLIALPSLYSIFSSMIVTMSSESGARGNSDAIMRLMSSLNPFLVLQPLLSDNHPSASYLVDDSGHLACVCYLILTVLFLFFTNRRLKRLENPGSRASR